MADYDVIADVTPKIKPLTRHAGRPSIAVLRETLKGLNGSYYTDDRLNPMTYNDLIAAVGGAVAPTFVTYLVTPNPVLNVAYGGFTFVASGSAPLTYLVASGTLPAGLTLSSAGVLGGTPTAAGTTNGIVIRASNPFGYDIVTISITVAAA